MRWLSAGVVLGVGLGGFVDGIVLHQIMQWHNMGSAVLPPTDMYGMTQNMLWDGLFHAATWSITVVGVYMLRADRNGAGETAIAFSGQMIFGWGAFNLAEGLIDHHLLNIHHVRDMPAHVPMYDWLFLTIGGLGFLGVGWAMVRRTRVSMRP